MRGVIQGGGAHELEVGVTVAPPDELQALLARREGIAGAKDAKAQPPR
jgi:hypothetical protein